jgi:hypothetical protein
LDIPEQHRHMEVDVTAPQDTATNQTEVLR